MNRNLHFLLLSAVGFLGIGALSPSTAFGQSRTCESLTALDLPDTTISSATAIDATPAWRVTGPENSTASVRLAAPFCRVEGTIEQEIGFEVWLPSRDWNGKFLGVGNGGYAGFINYSSMADALARRYATASTDTGHRARSSDSSWALGHPERIVNYGHRAHHLLARTVKQIVASYYGSAPRRSYFSGCSGGGMQALSEAQRYPDDYDGIVAGASGSSFTHMVAHLRWLSHLNAKDAPGRIPPGKAAFIANAVLSACDPKDGVKDGVIENPLSCDFDLSTLQCRGGTDGEACLTPAQLETARRIYAPMRNSAGREIYPGMAPGTLLSISASEDGLDRHGPMTADFFRYFVYGDPNWDWRAFDIDRDVADADAKVGAIVNATDPDLKPFKARGGKLILYHGWADNVVSPLSTLNYYKSVQAVIGEKETLEFSRIFMVPGMYHCRGGPGPNEFDMIRALEDWVEKGNAPDRVVASHRTDGKVDRTRPLCPFPRVARYVGSGSTDDAANFACQEP